MKLQFIKFDPKSHRELLAKFLSGQEWKFHVNSVLSEEKAFSLIDGGNFNGTENETFLIFTLDENLIGMIRLFDLDDIEEGDGSPLFDIRISNISQGTGIGTHSVQWIANYLFGTFPKLNRIEATTRADNTPMRKVLKKCYFLKEGHYRASWPNEKKELKDTVRYSILRSDWSNNAITPLNWDDF